MARDCVAARQPDCSRRPAAPVLPCRMADHAEGRIAALTTSPLLVKLGVCFAPEAAHVEVDVGAVLDALDLTVANVDHAV